MLAILKTTERTDNFSKIDNYVFQRHVFAYMEAVKHLKGTAIELGCGSGYGMEILAPHCSWIAGIDKHLPGPDYIYPNSAFFKCQLPILNNIGDNSFDTVISFQVIEHIKDDQAMISEIYRILRPGGKMLLTTPNKLMSLTRNPHHIREYTPDGFEGLIASSFTKYVLNGVYGGDVVMEYLEANRRSVQNLTSWDILNLQYNLPASFLKIPYNIANNVNRFFLYKRNFDTCNNINWSDYYLHGLGPTCLDLFAVAEKETISQLSK